MDSISPYQNCRLDLESLQTSPNSGESHPKLKVKTFTLLAVAVSCLLAASLISKFQVPSQSGLTTLNSKPKEKYSKDKNDREKDKQTERIANLAKSYVPAVNYQDPCDAVRGTCCTDQSYPVLGGVDLVYFALTGEIAFGEPKYLAELTGLTRTYKFWFMDRNYATLFSMNPENYLPMYGGFKADDFCAGNGLETLAKTTVDLSTASKVNNQITFTNSFSVSSSCSNIWATYFGSSVNGVFNTRCVSMESLSSAVGLYAKLPEASIPIKMSVLLGIPPDSLNPLVEASPAPSQLPETQGDVSEIETSVNEEFGSSSLPEVSAVYEKLEMSVPTLDDMKLPQEFEVGENIEVPLSINSALELEAAVPEQASSVEPTANIETSNREIGVTNVAAGAVEETETPNHDVAEVVAVPVLVATDAEKTVVAELTPQAPSEEVINSVLPLASLKVDLNAEEKEAVTEVTTPQAQSDEVVSAAQPLASLKAVPSSYDVAVAVSVPVRLDLDAEEKEAVTEVTTPQAQSDEVVSAVQPLASLKAVPSSHDVAVAVAVPVRLDLDAEEKEAVTDTAQPLASVKAVPLSHDVAVAVAVPVRLVSNADIKSPIVAINLPVQAEEVSEEAKVSVEDKSVPTVQVAESFDALKSRTVEVDQDSEVSVEDIIVDELKLAPNQALKSSADAALSRDELRAIKKAQNQVAFKEELTVAKLSKSIENIPFDSKSLEQPSSDNLQEAASINEESVEHLSPEIIVQSPEVAIKAVEIESAAQAEARSINPGASPEAQTVQVNVEPNVTNDVQVATLLQDNQNDVEKGALEKVSNIVPSIAAPVKVDARVALAHPSAIVQAVIAQAANAEALHQPIVTVEATLSKPSNFAHTEPVESVLLGSLIGEKNQEVKETTVQIAEVIESNDISEERLAVDATVEKLSNADHAQSVESVLIGALIGAKNLENSDKTADPSDQAIAHPLTPWEWVATIKIAKVQEMNEILKEDRVAVEAILAKPASTVNAVQTSSVSPLESINKLKNTEIENSDAVMGSSPRNDDVQIEKNEESLPAAAADSVPLEAAESTIEPSQPDVIIPTKKLAKQKARLETAASLLSKVAVNQQSSSDLAEGTNVLNEAQPSEVVSAEEKVSNSDSLNSISKLVEASTNSKSADIDITSLLNKFENQETPSVDAQALTVAAESALSALNNDMGVITEEAKDNTDASEQLVASTNEKDEQPSHETISHESLELTEEAKDNTDASEQLVASTNEDEQPSDETISHESLETTSAKVQIDYVNPVSAQKKNVEAIPVVIPTVPKSFSIVPIVPKIH
jgi:hypothetical protein